MVSVRSADEILDGLKHRDFLVLTMHAFGRNPRSVRNLLLLRRGPMFVGAAERRLEARGLLRVTDAGPVVTDDGKRALRTGAALLELEQFDAG